MPNTNPKLFISYSWSSPEHQEWVINLATELRDAGVDVILDKWDLKEGNDAIAFMEKMVSDPEIKKVAIICDHMYAEKADGRRGGVGTETQIISPEIYAKQDQSKFVAVLSERDESGKPSLPTYYKSRIYIDLSISDQYASEFERLLRWIYDKPLYIKPELGKQPAFLSEENAISLGTTVQFRRAIDAIRNNKEYANGALEEYLSTFILNLERFRITDKSGEFDDRVVDSIDRFLPFRNEAIELFFAIAQYRNTPEIIQKLHCFFENLIPYMEKPKDVTSWRDSDFDNFRFIIHELFLYAIACLLKYECFDSVSYLLRYGYYVAENSDYGRNEIVRFSVFYEPTRSFEYRNDRLKLNRQSIRADYLIERSKISGMTDRQLMQADFVLFIRDAFNSLKNGIFQSWYPLTLVYSERHSGSFELFARAQSKEYFERLKGIFDIQDKKDFEALMAAFKDNKLTAPRFGWTFVNPEILVGFEKLATRP
jgi:hypothetical protein